jgi:hypothetical protein
VYNKAIFAAARPADGRVLDSHAFAPDPAGPGMANRLKRGGWKGAVYCTLDGVDHVFAPFSRVGAFAGARSWRCYQLCTLVCRAP